MANALSAARDGDIIVVHSESQKEMGERALKRQHPGEKLSIVVSLEDISDAIDAAENKIAAVNRQ